MTAEIHVFDPARPVNLPAPLPANIPVEQQLLGAILANSEVLHRVGAYLLPDHFHEPVHGRIYAACRRLLDAGQPVSVVTLGRQFDADPDLKDVGGAQYLPKLLAGLVSVQDAEFHARTVFDLYQRRALIAFADGLRATAIDPAGEAPAIEIVRDAGAELDRIADGGPDEGEALSLEVAALATVQAAQDIAHGQVAPGLMTELTELDGKLGGLKPGALIVLGARPSMGKTALAARIAGRAAQQNPDAKVGYFSLEENETGISARLLSARAGVPYESILNGRVDDSDIARLASAQAALPRNLMIDPSGGLSLEQVRARALKLHRRGPLCLIVVDHIGLMRAPRHLEGKDRRHHIDHFTAGLKALAKEIGAPVLALSQLSRKVEERENKRPQLSDLRESGGIEQDADVVMFVFREEYYIERNKPRDPTELAGWQSKLDQARNKVEIIIDKARHGSVGVVPLFCQIAMNRFGNLERRAEL